MMRRLTLMENTATQIEHVSLEVENFVLENR